MSIKNRGLVLILNLKVMKKSFTLLISAMLITFTFQVQAQNFLYPGITELSLLYEAPFVATPPIIDGIPTDAAWDNAPWMQAQVVTPINSDWGTETPAAPMGAFSGPEDVSFNYKFIWDNEHYYMLMRWKDDVVIYSDYHNGYPGGNGKPAWAPEWNMPAVGAGTGENGYHAWRMDHISLWLTPYRAELADGTESYARATKGLHYGFFPAQIHSTRPESVLWGARNGGGENQRGRVAATYNDTEGAYYVEFRDTTWATLWDNVSLVTTTGYVPAIGDQLLFAGEINDADGTSNRRDYANFISALTTNANTNLSEAVVIKLVAGATGVNTASANRSLEIYPNPNSGSTLRLNRIVDVEIFNMAGQRVIQSLNTSEVNISGLQPGIYMVKDKEGNVGKLVRK